MKRTFLLLAGTAVLLALTGCQRALNVGAVNRSGHPIEIVGDSAAELRQYEARIDREIVVEGDRCPAR